MSSNNPPPLLQGASLCAWLYTLVLSLLSGVLGWGLIALCYSSFSLPVTETGIVGRFCLVTGIVLVVFVLLWNIFIFCAWRGSRHVTEECQRGKGQKSYSRPRSNTSVTSMLGKVSLVLLTFSILLELSGTGLLWWASLQLSDQYTVRGDCFCVKGTGQQGSVRKNIFSVNCPVIEGLVCDVVYSEKMVTMRSVTVSTRDCQRLDGSQQDPACLEFRTFWNLFKVLRIVLPVMAIIQLPVLLMNCSRWLCKEEKQNHKSSHGKFAADSVSWIGLDVLLSPLRLVDPVHFYSNMCTPIGNQPPLGERLPPIGQEFDIELTCLPSKQATLRVATRRSYPPLTAVHCPVPPCGVEHEESQTSQAPITKDDSPPDIEQHTISTPIHAKLRTPSFDLSKVVKPVYHNTSVEAEVPTRKLNLQPDVVRSSRVSSFSSYQVFKAPPPTLLVPEIPEVRSKSLHPPPPFNRSTMTLPRTVRISSTESNSTLPKQVQLDPSQISPLPTPTVMGPDSDHDTSESGSVHSVTQIIRLKPNNSCSSKSSPKWQSSTPFQMSPTIGEISQKARDKYSGSSTVDWTKLP
eukprot:GFUD01020752.1.p1 GENE.GFUD01020752.1~~GFUD01020752.1.p1  ORF type:complete len:575 (-),score=81.20 GFUD01020752.1:106-1830(-)